ncbi:MAG: hypothetical protein R3F53_14955 [Gammaproteobacteria bacterium]
MISASTLWPIFINKLHAEPRSLVEVVGIFGTIPHFVGALLAQAKRASKTRYAQAAARIA